jgi:hypothetical protein
MENYLNVRYTHECKFKFILKRFVFISLNDDIINEH